MTSSPSLFIITLLHKASTIRQNGPRPPPGFRATVRLVRLVQYYNTVANRNSAAANSRQTLCNGHPRAEPPCCTRPRRLHQRPAVCADAWFGCFFFLWVMTSSYGHIPVVHARVTSCWPSQAQATHHKCGRALKSRHAQISAAPGRILRCQELDQSGSTAKRLMAVRERVAFRSMICVPCTTLTMSSVTSSSARMLWRLTLGWVGLGTPR